MNKALAILHKYPTADPLDDFRVSDDGGGPVLELWKVKDATGAPIPPPTDTEIAAWWSEYEAAVSSTEYRRQRAAEYPPLGDQLDAIWKVFSPPAGSDAETLKAQIMAIKARYPKPT